MGKIIKHLTFIMEVSDATCGHIYDKGKQTSIQLFCLGLLERLSNTSRTLKELFLGLSKNPANEFSAGVLTRMLLLDALVAMNLFRLAIDAEKENKTEEEIKELLTEYCDTILSDGLEGAFKFLEDTQKFGYINEAQLKDAFNNWGTKYERFLNSHIGDGSRPIVKYKFIAPTKLFNCLANHADFKKIVINLYDPYLYFSKYDHFGIFYFELLRENKEEKMALYKNAFSAFVLVQSMLHLILDKSMPNDGLIKSQREKAEKYATSQVSIIPSI